MGPVFVSYLHIVGEAGTTAWEAATSSACSARDDGTNGNREPWAGEEGLAWGRDEELWPPLVFAMSGMCEGFRKGGRFL